MQLIKNGIDDAVIENNYVNFTLINNELNDMLKESVCNLLSCMNMGQADTQHNVTLKYTIGTQST